MGISRYNISANSTGEIFVKTHRSNKSWRVANILVERWFMESHLNTLTSLHNLPYSSLNEFLVREEPMMVVDGLLRIETLYKDVIFVVYLAKQYAVSF
jgi:hypothetical protein